MARKGYITIALPEDLIKEVDIILKRKIRGYTSRGDFVKQAVRNLLDKHEQDKK